MEYKNSRKKVCVCLSCLSKLIFGKDSIFFTCELWKRAAQWSVMVNTVYLHRCTIYYSSLSTQYKKRAWHMNIFFLFANCCCWNEENNITMCCASRAERKKRNVAFPLIIKITMSLLSSPYAQFFTLHKCTKQRYAP